jgi:prophage regulatory protein
MTTSSKFLRLPQVKQTTGLSKSTIYARIAEGTFPKQIPLGPRLVLWVESGIQNWIAEKVSAARGWHPSFLCVLSYWSDLQPAQVACCCFKRGPACRKVHRSTQYIKSLLKQQVQRQPPSFCRRCAWLPHRCGWRPPGVRSDGGRPRASALSAW